MLVEDRANLTSVEGNELLEIADYLCHEEPVVRPIFECVKVFARIHESGDFTYARFPMDLGTNVVTSIEISSRMKEPKRCAAVLAALDEVESRCRDVWPFSPGSSSWVLIEILHPEINLVAEKNAPTIIFRKAVRLNGRGDHTVTPLLERVFSSFSLPASAGQFKLVIDPTLQLMNTSGEGVFTRLKEQVEGMLYLTEGASFEGYAGLKSVQKEVTADFIDELLESNFSIPSQSNPGFYFTFKGENYRVRSNSFSFGKKKRDAPLLPPLPVLGVIK